jgi:hypothetical protein
MDPHFIADKEVTLQKEINLVYKVAPFQLIIRPKNRNQ